MSRKVLRDAITETQAFQYKLDEPDDYWQTPAETERLGTGDCEDSSVFAISKAASQLPGVTFRLVCGNVGKQGHAWVEMDDGKETVWADPLNGTIATPEMFTDWLPIYAYEWTGKDFGKKYQYVKEETVKKP